MYTVHAEVERFLVGVALHKSLLHRGDVHVDPLEDILPNGGEQGEAGTVLGGGGVFDVAFHAVFCRAQLGVDLALAALMDAVAHGEGAEGEDGCDNGCNQQRAGKFHGCCTPFVAGGQGEVICQLLHKAVVHLAKEPQQFLFVHTEMSSFLSSCRSAARRRQSRMETALGVMPMSAAMSSMLCSVK